MDDLQAAGLLDPVDTALERLGLEGPDEDEDEVELETDAEDA
jgi:ribosome assembly protein YihI (activator of Der GTPase)